MRFLLRGAAAIALLLAMAVPAAPAAAAQTLTWTADDSVTQYKSVPTTAVTGETTVVFENSTATGNTTGMPHTLTFDTSTPGYNHDVTLNILANPFDTNNGRHTATVTLTEGRYRYYCTIPGHSSMVGELVVTGGEEPPEDTTAPTVSATVTGNATVTVTATDTDSGVARVEYQLDDGAWTPYTAPVSVTAPGAHVLRARATDTAGNTSEPVSVSFTVTEPEPDEDVTAPTVAAQVGGTRDDAGNYVGSATVTVTAADDDSGVARVEVQVDGGTWAAYTQPVVVTGAGPHMVHYRATDNAGNTSAEQMAHFTVVAGDGGGTDECPGGDARATVFLGGTDTGVPNADTGNGCTVSDLIDEDAGYPTHAAFVRHVEAVTNGLVAAGTLTARQAGTLVRAAARS
uniref:cupredoxin domain-containing protein n=1 Tax=Actinoplanes sp. RD1 TaxID=3064538 RepID=UPI002741A04D|nr:Ig-like domain-containing protein [Actinoplanes sp. RD1]